MRPIRGVGWRVAWQFRPPSHASLSAPAVISTRSSIRRHEPSSVCLCDECGMVTPVPAPRVMPLLHSAHTACACTWLATWQVNGRCGDGDAHTSHTCTRTCEGISRPLTGSADLWRGTRARPKCPSPWCGGGAAQSPCAPLYYIPTASRVPAVAAQGQSPKLQGPDAITMCRTVTCATCATLHRTAHRSAGCGTVRTPSV